MSDLRPPKVPTTKAGLDRALMILGNRAQGRSLKPKTQAEVVELIGVYPSAYRAGVYKKHLKAVRKQFATNSSSSAIARAKARGLPSDSIGGQGTSLPGLIQLDDNIQRMTGDHLLAVFGAESSGRLIIKRLMRSLIWQVVTQIRAGEIEPVDGNLRSFYYRFVKPVFARIPGGLNGKAEPYEYMLDIFVELVSVRRLFAYGELGLVDDNWQHRRLGDRRVATVLYTEKMGFFRWLVRQQQAHGCTVFALGGAPSWLSTEYLIAQLRLEADYSGPVELIGVVDFDPSGWALAHAFENQLVTLGAEVTAHHHLVSPNLLPADQLEWVTYPLANHRRTKTLNGRWLDATGGIGGELKGMEADAIPKALLTTRLVSVLRDAPNRRRPAR